MVANQVAFLAYTNQTIYSVGYQEGLDAFKNRLIGKCEIVEDANIEDIVSESIFKVVMIQNAILANGAKRISARELEIAVKNVNKRALSYLKK